MVLTTKTKLSLIGSEESLRFDAKFIKFQNRLKQEDFRYFYDLFDIVEKKPVAPPNAYRYCEIGNVDKDGQIYPIEMNDDERTELNEPLFKKIDQGDIFKPEKGDILVASVRPNLKKYVYVNENCKDVFFTKAFIQLRPLLNSEILYYLLRTILYDSVVAVSRQGKGYPTLKEDDLNFVKIESKLIEKVTALSIETERSISYINDEIRKHTYLFKNPQSIINETIAKSFDINTNIIQEAEKMTKLKAHTRKLPIENINMRISYRWNKLKILQTDLLRELDDVAKLGRYIISTQNGWSPNSNDFASNQGVLGIDSIQQSGRIDLDRLKFTDEIRKDIDLVFIHKNDFLVSRGNTPGLVALAGVVEDEPEDTIIFPDLMIRVVIDKRIDPNYLAYIFNSFFGRLYFKYAAKGKNQTMVKISSQELNDFMLPVPPIAEQNIIARTIKDLLSSNNVHLEKIKKNRIKIEDLVFATFS